jgi:hypothetical protein
MPLLAFRIHRLIDLLRFVLACIVAMLLLFVLPPTANAADLPLKAKPPQTGFATYPVGCGMYYGLNTMGETSAVTDTKVGTQFVQGAIGLTLGYTCPMGLAGGYWFVDGMFDFANLNGSANGLSLSGPAQFEQRFGVGAPVSLLLNLVPGLSSLQNAVPSLIPLPAGVAVVTSFPYLFAGLHEDDVGVSNGFAANKQYLISTGFGLGNKTRLSNGAVFDPFVEYILPSSQMCIGIAGGCVKRGAALRVGAALEF